MLTDFYHLLESTPSTTTEPLFKPLSSWLSSAAGAVFNLLLVEPDTEPRVTQVQGQNGELFWEVYEPVSEQTVYCSSEEEVMQWLDSNRWM